MRLVLLFMCVLGITFASAQNLNKGDEAYKNRDFETALSHYKTACENGNGNACYKVGDMYDIGLGVFMDEAKALSYFQQACDAGYNKGCVTVKDRDQSLHVGW